MRGLARALAEMASDDDDGIDADRKDSRLPGAVLDDLMSRFRAYTAPRSFKVGDLVELVPGMDRYRFPEKGRPAIVVELIDRREPRDEGAPHEYAPQTLRIGYVAFDGEFCTFPVDGNCYRPWTPPATTSPAVQ